MLHCWLLSLVLIVSWYPRSDNAFTGAAASGESFKIETTRPASASCRASGRRHLMEETDHTETATSDVEILNTFGHEMVEIGRAHV